MGSADGKGRWRKGGVVMISEVGSVTFVWRCSGCPAVYDGESIALLLDDGTSKACSCGGRLMEDVGTVPEHERGVGAMARRSPVGFLRGV